MSKPDKTFDPLAALMGDKPRPAASKSATGKGKPMAPRKAIDDPRKTVLIKMPLDLHGALKLRSAASGKSMVQVANEALESVLGAELETVRKSQERMK